MQQHNILKILTLSTSFLAAMIAPGCATVKTTKIDRAKPGLAYFLPKQMTKVTVKRTAADIQKAIKALTAADGALAKAKKAHSEAESAVKLTEAIIKDDRISDAEKAKYKLNLVKEEQAVIEAKTDLDSKQLKFDAAKLALESLIPGAPIPTGTDLEKAKLALREAKRALALTQKILGDARIPADEKKPYVYKSHIELQAVQEAQRVLDKEEGKFDESQTRLQRVKDAKEALKKATEKYDEAQSAYMAQKKKHTDAQNGLLSIKTILSSNSLTPEQRQDYELQLGDASELATKAKSALDVKSELYTEAADLQQEKQEILDNLPAVVETAIAKPKKYILDVKMELQAPTADTDYGYSLNPKHNWMRDDTHKVKVTPAGLLSTVNIVAADRTADIVTELAIFAGALSGNIPTGDAGGGTKSNLCLNTPEEIILMVDFANEHSVSALNSELKCFGMKVDNLSSSGNWVSKKTKNAVSGATTTVHDKVNKVPGAQLSNNASFVGTVVRKKDDSSWGGLFYRTPVDVVLKISQCSKVPCEENVGWVTTKMLSQNLPQAGPISFVRQDAGLMTKTTYDLGFKDGVLTSYDANRPSEVLEVAKVPMKIIHGLADGVSKMVSIQIGKNKKLAELSESELALLQAQLGVQSGENTALTSIATSELALLQARLGLQSGENNALAAISESELALLQARLGVQAGQNNALANLSESELALLQAQMSLQTGANANLQNLYASQLSLLQAQLELERGGIAGRTALSESELESLRASAALSNAENDINAQAVASQLAALISITRDRARIDLIETCLKDQVAAGESTDICLEGP